MNCGSYRELNVWNREDKKESSNWSDGERGYELV